MGDCWCAFQGDSVLCSPFSLRFKKGTHCFQSMLWLREGSTDLTASNAWWSAEVNSKRHTRIHTEKEMYLAQITKVLLYTLITVLISEKKKKTLMKEMGKTARRRRK